MIFARSLKELRALLALAPKENWDRSLAKLGRDYLEQAAVASPRAEPSESMMHTKCLRSSCSTKLRKAATILPKARPMVLAGKTMWKVIVKPNRVRARSRAVNSDMAIRGECRRCQPGTPRSPQRPATTTT
jgi:hypothetical protein